MTLNKECFQIQWPGDEKVEAEPATDSEILDAVSRVQQKVLNSKEGDVIHLTLRRPVAKAVAKGINESNTAFAMLDVNGPPSFVPERGGYESILYVSKDEETMGLLMGLEDPTPRY
jgi:hypothetical protein